MTTVIGIRFKDGGKVYYFDPKEFDPKIGEYVIVETARGMECGSVAMERGEIEDSSVVSPLKQVIRLASEKEKSYENHMDRTLLFQSRRSRIPNRIRPL
jgi:cell fate regulator YaaT (PSP1 superfamily)